MGYPEQFNHSESSDFLAKVDEIFGAPPYNSDPRKEMMYAHIVNGRSSSKTRIQQILPYLSKPASETRVLDTGCGSGMASAAFSELGFQSIFGIDLGEEPIGLPIAHLRNYGHETSVNFIQANGYCIPFSDKSFDLCWCSFVVEHIPEPDKLFREIFRVLAPNGIFYISTNNRLWPIEPHSGTMWASWLPTHWAEKYARWRQHWPKHVFWDVYLPTYWQLNRWAAEAGFGIIASTPDLIGAKSQHVLKKVPFVHHLAFLFPNLYLILKKQ
jgi:SAM-dependent methyltransferase